MNSNCIIMLTLAMKKLKREDTAELPTLAYGILRESLKTNEFTRNICEKKQSAFLSLGGEDD